MKQSKTEKTLKPPATNPQQAQKSKNSSSKVIPKPSTTSNIQKPPLQYSVPQSSLLILPKNPAFHPSINTQINQTPTLSIALQKSNPQAFIPVLEQKNNRQ